MAQPSNPYEPSDDRSLESSENSLTKKKIQLGEGRSVIWATAWFFFVLLSYSIVRPVRETMGAIGGTRELQGLMLVTFAVMLIAVPAYSTLVAKLPRRWVVRIVFHFFCVSLFTFALLMRSPNPQVQVWSARVFFLWVNVFALFSTSVFWSVLADLFSNEQGKRLFGSIAAGGTAGAILGSFLTSQLATHISTEVLLCIPIVTLQAGLWCAWRLEKQASRLRAARSSEEPQATEGKPTGGGLLAGITRVASNPYLASICLFLFFAHAFATQMYFQQAEIVKDAIPVREEKTQLFAYIDLGTQILTLIIQVALAAPILRRLGVSIALVILPIVYFAGFSALAFYPTLVVVIVAMIAVRSTAYGITVPAREVLFTVVDREDKYKSKSFIDTVVLRGGDAIGGQAYGFLRNFEGYGMMTLNLWALPLTAIWAMVAIRLGKRQKHLAKQSEISESS